MMSTEPINPTNFKKEVCGRRGMTRTMLMLVSIMIALIAVVLLLYKVIRTLPP